jgi:hypothetical protein
MHIAIEDHNPTGALLCQHSPCGHRDVVEDTEPRAEFGEGVVRPPREIGGDAIL